MKAEREIFHTYIYVSPFLKSQKLNFKTSITNTIAIPAKVRVWWRMLTDVDAEGTARYNQGGG